MGLWDSSSKPGIVRKAEKEDLFTGASASFRASALILSDCVHCL